MARLSSTTQKTLNQISALIAQRRKGALSWRQRDKSLQPLIIELAKSGINPDVLTGHTPGWVIRDIRWARSGGRHRP